MICFYNCDPMVLVPNLSGPGRCDHQWALSDRPAGQMPQLIIISRLRPVTESESDEFD
jgi:hypothetical protein